MFNIVFEENVVPCVWKGFEVNLFASFVEINQTELGLMY